MKVEREIDIAARPERVYHVVMDARRLEEWVTIHAGLRDAPASALRQGSELTQCLKVAGQRFDVRWQVTRADPAECVVWEGQGPARSRARVVYGFRPNGNGTRFTYRNELDLPGGPLGRMAGLAVARAGASETERSLRRLKELMER